MVESWWIRSSRLTAAESLWPTVRLSDRTLSVHWLTLAAYFRTLDTGAGEHIDLSAHACVASFVEMNVYFYSYPGQNRLAPGA